MLTKLTSSGPFNAFLQKTQLYCQAAVRLLRRSSCCPSCARDYAEPMCGFSSKTGTIVRETDFAIVPHCPTPATRRNRSCTKPSAPHPTLCQHINHSRGPSTPYAQPTTSSINSTTAQQASPMSKQVVLLALAGMCLLALAVNAQTGDKKAEVLKRHQSKYGAPKHSNVSLTLLWHV